MPYRPFFRIPELMLGRDRSSYSGPNRTMLEAILRVCRWAPRKVSRLLGMPIDVEYVEEWVKTCLAKLDDDLHPGCTHGFQRDCPVCAHQICDGSGMVWFTGKNMTFGAGCPGCRLCWEPKAKPTAWDRILADE